MITSVFVVSFKIAAPITAAILIADIALGVIANAVPQMNVFVVGMPLKILVGLIVIFLTWGRSETLFMFLWVACIGNDQIP